MGNKRKSFFERLTGSVGLRDEYEEEERNSFTLQDNLRQGNKNKRNDKDKKDDSWMEEEEEEAELAVDVYETPNEIVLQTMVAGVHPEDLELSVTRDTITISGKREENRVIEEDNYFTKELYWGKFSRTINLPEEVEPEEVEATEKHGLLTMKIKKLDKGKRNNIRVKSI